MERFIDILTDLPADTPWEVFRRIEAVEALAAIGPAAYEAMPALLRTLVVPVSVDCALALRVAAAEAVWKVGGRHDLALPLLAWALRDEYWGVSRKAAAVLGEMGTVAHAAIPDLVRLAERRCAQGQFHFEEAEQATSHAAAVHPLLAVIATALGQCGRGAVYRHEAQCMLSLLATSLEPEVRTAATEALLLLGSSPSPISEALATTPEPPYYAAIFTSCRTAGDKGYAAMAQRMRELAAQQPGFLGAESVRGADGVGITVSYWESEESIRQWKSHAEHQAAQQTGRQVWYADYMLRIAKVERAYGTILNARGGDKP